ncbi:MAG: serine/threonine-protein kinase [Planctomycetota bacterium]
MADAHETSEVITLTALALEMGMITQHEALLVDARRDALRRGGIKMTLGQTLLERKFIEPFQIKPLMKEFERRTAQVAPPKQRLENKMFGPYKLLEIISEKTHSRIIRAHDTVMDRIVVLKILPSNLKNDPQWSERFRRETTLMGKMAHPNLVQAFAAQEIEGCPVIAMEYVDGSTIGDRIEHEGFLPEKEAWLIGREIAKALAYAARLGVIHRDIKPDNIVCSRGGKVKLIDMGFSKSLSDTTHLTVEGTTVGTPFYISPEQAKGTRDLDARTDIYSLGCTIYHMLTGTPPFWGDEITEIMLKHIECPRPDPRKLVPGLSQASVDLVTRMISVRPEKRPQTADAVVEEITAMLPLLPKLFGPTMSGLTSGLNQTPIESRKLSDVPRIPAQAQTSDGPVVRKPNDAPREGVWARVKSWLGF